MACTPLSESASVQESIFPKLGNKFKLKSCGTNEDSEVAVFEPLSFLFLVLNILSTGFFTLGLRVKESANILRVKSS